MMQQHKLRCVKISSVLVLLFAILTGTDAIAQGAVPFGQIQGSIFTQANQPIPKAIVVVQQQDASAAPAFEASGVAGPDGSFTFSGVPVGTFLICVQVPGSSYLNPCTWSNNPPSVTLTNRLGGNAGRIRMDEGQLLKVKLNDANKLLQTDEGKVPGAKVLIGVFGPNGLFVPMRVRARSEEHTSE